MSPRAIHLIGIGGAGMSALARLAAEVGYLVSGSDRDDSPLLATLRAQGIVAYADHDADHLPPDSAAVVVSSAIGEDNPELTAARGRGLPIFHRSELLAELMMLRRGLAVAGAHGKSTTSAMLALALGDASACIGASLPGGDGTGARWGAGPWFVAEADESDRSLLNLRPEAAIVVNVDHDHHANYASLEEVEGVMRAFVAALPSDGVLVIGPDEIARRLAAAAPCEVRLVGEVPGARWWAEGSGADATLVAADGRLVAMPLAIPGRHNADNAACAVALAEWCGVDPAVAAGRLADFVGVGRRFEIKGQAGGITVVDDYAHHPAEVSATIAAARERRPHRVVAVFQPHLVSRTKALSGELGLALSAADLVVVTDIYLAREAPEEGITGQLVADAVDDATGVRYVPQLADVSGVLVPLLAPGDLVLTLGAGTITGLGQELLAAVQKVDTDELSDPGTSHAPSD